MPEDSATARGIAAESGPAARVANWFTPAEWLRLGAIYGAVAALHLLGWGIFLHFASGQPVLAGLGLTAYLLGVRHAFDADHVAAVDDTVRFMSRDGRRPLGIGFFFSCGHSSVVLAMTVGIAFAATAIRQEMPILQRYGGVIGALFSAGFLWLIGTLNLLLLIGMLRHWRRVRRGHHDHTHIEELLRRRGLLNRLFGNRAQKLIRRSWQMYPLGVLFGLGFDTASEVAVLGMAATASVGHVPIAAVLSLPILFAAGMTVMDTTDGVLMTKAYHWAFVNPDRKLFYNICMTATTVAVALAVGGIELVGIVAAPLHLRGDVVAAIASLDLERVGWLVVVLLLGAWALCFAAWRLRRRGWPRAAEAVHTDVHTHESGLTHIHRHYH